jgi:4-hydroxybenzoate polyprenyltransferase
MTANKTQLSLFKSMLTAMRINQWTKNAVVLAAAFFAYWDRNVHPHPSIKQLMLALPAAFLFCLTSSGVYVFNDIIDMKADRLHPAKKSRPVASGELSVFHAGIESVILLIIAIYGGFILSSWFGLILCTYTGLQIVYTLYLKRIPFVDVLVISAGFVLRAIAGAVVVHVEISPWLILCTFLLSLFLALCKRRHEKVEIFSNQNELTRSVLISYSTQVLDILIGISGGCTILAYSIYTLWPDTVKKFGTQRLTFTIPFVIFGIFRYIDLVYRHRQGDKPEKILLTDVPLIINVLLYMITVLLVLFYSGYKPGQGI